MFDNIIKSLSPESQSGVDPEEASVKAARHPEVMDASHTVLSVLSSVHGATAERPQSTSANQTIASETMYVVPPNQIVQGSNANPLFLQQARRDTENALNQESVNG
jgi:hypothetical protein